MESSPKLTQSQVINTNNFQTSSSKTMHVSAKRRLSENE